MPQLLGVHDNREKLPQSSEEGQVPSIELKGARKMAAPSEAASSSASSSSTGVVGATGTLDLNETDCCRKLKQFLLPYLQQASSRPSMGSRSSSSTNMARMNSAENAAMGVHAGVMSSPAQSPAPHSPERKPPQTGAWVSPPPAN